MMAIIFTFGFCLTAPLLQLEMILKRKLIGVVVAGIFYIPLARQHC